MIVFPPNLASVSASTCKMFWQMFKQMFQSWNFSLSVFSFWNLTLFIILIKPLTIKDYCSCASGDCGTYGYGMEAIYVFRHHSARVEDRLCM